MDSSTEIAETTKLLQQVEHPNLKKLLQKHLVSLEDQEKRQAQAVAKVNDLESKPVLTTSVNDSKDTPIETTSSVLPATIPAKRLAPLTGTYIPIEDYAWDQGEYNSAIVSIFIDLPDVGKVKQNCKISFTKMGFDFSVTDLNGKNYRLVNDNLDKDIVPESSSMVVKANRVILKLQKVKGEYSYEHWNSLIAKKKRDPTAESSKKKDPMGGIMDMMKDMYEDGDENMKKIIGEAMMKSQTGQLKDPKNPSKFDDDMNM